MATRVISAAVGIPVFLGVVWWGAMPFALAVLVLTAIALGEMLATYLKQGIRPNPALAALGLLGPSWVVLRLLGMPEGVAGIAIGLAVLAPIWELKLRPNQPGSMKQRIGFGLLCGGYLSLFGAIAALRARAGFAPSPYSGQIPLGVAVLLLPVFCVWATDSFAYFTGRAIGKHKLAPAISPNKTVEGTLGGLIASLLAGAGFGWLLLGSVGGGLIAGAVAGTLGQAGDLFESWLKRRAGVKDFGGIMPGHGGVLDRFDSLLFVAPATLLLLPMIVPHLP